MPVKIIRKNPPTEGASKKEDQPNLVDPNWQIIKKVEAKAKGMTPKQARDYLDRMANLWGPEVKTHQEIIKLIEKL